MESGACAVEAGLLQAQTGRPVTKHCTALCHKDYCCQPDSNTEHSEYRHFYISETRSPSLQLPMLRWGDVFCLFLPHTEDVSPALRYSGRPVEGAARRAAPALRLFQPKGLPASANGTIYCSQLRLHMPDPTGPVCIRRLQRFSLQLSPPKAPHIPPPQ